MASKPLINFNIPKGEGNFTGRKWVTFAAFAVATVAVWNWSGRIPMIGPYAIKAKAFITKAVGG